MSGKEPTIVNDIIEGSSPIRKESNLHFATPRTFFQISFNQQTHVSEVVEIASPTIKVDWKNPKIYENGKCKPLFIHNELDLPVPSCIGITSDSSTVASSCSESVIMDQEDVWEQAVMQRDRMNKECSAVVYFPPFRSINEFEFFSPTLTCMDVDDNPAIPLCAYDVDTDKCLSFKKSFFCIFPSYYHLVRKRTLSSSSDEDHWRRSFLGYQQLDKSLL